jgi:hypothetical protein
MDGDGKVHFTYLSSLLVAPIHVHYWPYLGIKNRFEAISGVGI